MVIFLIWMYLNWTTLRFFKTWVWETNWHFESCFVFDAVCQAYQCKIIFKRSRIKIRMNCHVSYFCYEWRKSFNKISNIHIIFQLIKKLSILFYFSFFSIRWGSNYNFKFVIIFWPLKTVCFTRFKNLLYKKKTRTVIAEINVNYLPSQK